MFNNIIPAALIEDMLRNTQLELDMDIPEYTIEEKYICAVPVSYSMRKRGKAVYGTTGSVDHPSFAGLRKHLAAKGLIKIPDYPCVNGDRVKKKFTLNGVLFKEGDRFLSGSAMSFYLERMRNGNSNV